MTASLVLVLWLLFDTTRQGRNHSSDSFCSAEQIMVHHHVRRQKHHNSQPPQTTTANSFWIQQHRVQKKANTPIISSCFHSSTTNYYADMQRTNKNNRNAFKKISLTYHKDSPSTKTTVPTTVSRQKNSILLKYDTTRPCSTLQMNNNNNQQGREEDDHDQSKILSDVIIDGISKGINILKQPLSIFGTISVSVGIILILLLQALVLPILQSSVNVVLFLLFSIVGRKVILSSDDIEDNPFSFDTTVTTNKSDADAITSPEVSILQIDLFALFSSFISTSLLLPPELVVLDNKSESVTYSIEQVAAPILILFLFILVVALGASATISDTEKNERLTLDEKILYRWDLKFQRDNKTTGDETKKQ